MFVLAIKIQVSTKWDSQLLWETMEGEEHVARYNNTPAHNVNTQATMIIRDRDKLAFIIVTYTGDSMWGLAS